MPDVLEQKELIRREDMALQNKNYLPTKDEDRQREFDEEMKAREDDRNEARKQMKQYEDTELPEPFIEIRRHIGVGPLAYETNRGLIKVHSGEIIATFEYETGEQDAYGNLLLDDNGEPKKAKEVIVMVDNAWNALFPQVLPHGLPDSENRIAERLGEERRLKVLEEKHPELKQRREQSGMRKGKPGQGQLRPQQPRPSNPMFDPEPPDADAALQSPTKLPAGRSVESTPPPANPYGHQGTEKEMQKIPQAPSSSPMEQKGPPTAGNKPVSHRPEPPLTGVKTPTSGPGKPQEDPTFKHEDNPPHPSNQPTGEGRPPQPNQDLPRPGGPGGRPNQDLPTNPGAQPKQPAPDETRTPGRPQPSTKK